MNQISSVESIVTPFVFPSNPSMAYEYKVMALRECPTPEELVLCECPDAASKYWKMHVATHPHFNPEVECLVVLILNVRGRIKGHQLVSIGTQDSLLIHPREIFRLAITTSAHSIILMHNHPSGESSPSFADISMTKQIAEAGKLLKIDLKDHVIVGAGETYSSLRTLGHF